MKSIKKIIIALTIILLVLILIFLMINKKQSNLEEEYEETGPQDTLVKLESKVSKETDDYKFFTVDNHINNFFNYIKNNEREKANAILNEKYIQQNNVQDISKILKLSNKIVKWYSQEMYKRESLENTIYYVYRNFGNRSSEWNEKIRRAVYLF